MSDDDRKTPAGPRDPIRIDPEIGRSHTLPGWAYHDPDLYRTQQERVFARSWQFLADADAVKPPGHVLPLTLLEGEGHVRFLRCRYHGRKFGLDGCFRSMPEFDGVVLHRVEMEDEEIVESVQRGVRSRLYRRGRFSPRREVGTHHFHQLLDQAMGVR